MCSSRDVFLSLTCLFPCLFFFRTWILTLNYGYCFGVELTINNVIVAYFFDQFGLSIEIAGIVGAVFGLMNIFCRSLGGIASDVMGNYFGMRGRLWTYFILQVRGLGMADAVLLCSCPALSPYPLAGAALLVVACFDA